jgi:hypothetical protein
VRVFSRRALSARIAAPVQGGRLVLAALRLIRAQPAIAAVASLTAIELIVGFWLLEPVMLKAAVSWVGPVAGGPLATTLTVVLCWLPVSVLDSYGDVIALTMLRERQLGGRPTLRGAMRVANRRLRAIAGWAGISVLSLVSLGLLRLVPGTRLLRWGGKAAWELATFFAIPVIAFEGRGPGATVRRSRHLIGPSPRTAIAPAAGMFVACLPAFVPGLVLTYLAYLMPVFALPPGTDAAYPPPDGTLLALAMVAFVPAATLLGISTLLLRYALYERAVGNEAPDAYSARDLESAMPGVAV